MNTLPVVARTLAQLIHYFSHLCEHVTEHEVRIRALEEQVAALQEHVLDKEEVTSE